MICPFCGANLNLKFEDEYLTNNYTVKHFIAPSYCWYCKIYLWTEDGEFLGKSI